MLRRLIAPLLALVLFAVLPLLAQQQADRVKEIGGKFQCMCGCSQVLTQCNHVGCTVSTSMLKELGTFMVSRGDSEDKITQTSSSRNSAPRSTPNSEVRLHLVAWLMPVFYFLIGAAIVVFFIMKWRNKPAPAAVAPAGVHISPEAYERARSQASRDTED